MIEPGPEVVVAGYASLDSVWRSSGVGGPGRTVLLSGDVDPAPKLGGCAQLVAMELARLGRRTELVSWLGDDESGRRYLEHLRATGVGTAGVEVGPGPSPRTLLIYDPDGGATCYYHPSGARDQRLTPEVRAWLGGACTVAVTVGPSTLTSGLLDAMGPDVRLAWSVKADPDAFPLGLRRRLLAGSALICFNGDELFFLAEAVSADVPRSVDAALAALRAATRAVLVLTLGAGGARVVWPDGDQVVHASPLQVADPTGAGDAFFAGFLAAVLAGERPVAAASRAMDSATAFLRRGEGD
jgi:sugar/nucleoside kinase (ribokinase family)